MKFYRLWPIFNSTCQAFLSFSSFSPAFFFFFYKGMRKKIKKEVFREIFCHVATKFYRLWPIFIFVTSIKPRGPSLTFHVSSVSVIFKFLFCIFFFTRACKRRLRKKYFVKIFATLRPNFIDFGQFFLFDRLNRTHDLFFDVSAISSSLFCVCVCMKSRRNGRSILRKFCKKVNGATLMINVSKTKYNFSCERN